MEGRCRRTCLWRNKKRLGVWRGGYLLQPERCGGVFVSNEAERATRFQDAVPCRTVAWIADQRQMAGTRPPLECDGRNPACSAQPNPGRQTPVPAWRQRRFCQDPRIGHCALIRAGVAFLYARRPWWRRSPDVLLGHSSGRRRSIRKRPAERSVGATVKDAGVGVWAYPTKPWRSMAYRRSYSYSTLQRRCPVAW